MAIALNDKVLAETFGASEGAALRLKQAALVAFGVVFLAVCAKISVPMFPVPITMGTFAVLGLGAAYGPRLGLTTIMLYMIIGAAGMDVFASSSAENNGVSYMLGGSGGYLVGYVLATLALGTLARAGWDRSPVKMAGAMLLGNAIIYIPGLIWLGMSYGWDKPILEWGFTPFIIGDAIKLALAAMLIPAAWKFIGKARG
jgi:biotin transport system substrate-specific component